MRVEFAELFLQHSHGEGAVRTCSYPGLVGSGKSHLDDIHRVLPLSADDALLDVEQSPPTPCEMAGTTMGEADG